MKIVDVAIVGGGIAGLSTAYYLQKEMPDAHYTLIEASDRWGGKIRTDVVELPEYGRFVVEGGPDAFITQKPWGLELARELGLDDALLPTNDEKRQVYVVNKGKPTPLPDGVLLIVPTKFTPFALSPLISPLGKLRMGMDLFIKPKRDGEDETLAEFITRRLGSEALDKIAEPLMSGIYNAEAEKQSVLATFPRFRASGRKIWQPNQGHACLAQAACRFGTDRQWSRVQRPPSVFMSMRNGMTDLVDTLVAGLTGDLKLNTQVAKITPETRVGSGYLLHLADGETVAARSVVLATPAHVASHLLREPSPAAAAALERIRYVSTGTISLAFDAGEIEHELNGFGVVIPRSEKRAINAVTWTSTKFDHRAPAGAVLLRCFFGGSRRPEMMDVGDEELLGIVRTELAGLLGIRAEPLFHRIYRWMQANPQYDVGHLTRVGTVEDALPAGLFVTGSPYRGVGIPDCVHQAQTTAKMVQEWSASQTSRRPVPINSL